MGLTKDDAARTRACIIFTKLFDHSAAAQESSATVKNPNPLDNLVEVSRQNKDGKRMSLYEFLIVGLDLPAWIGLTFHEIPGWIPMRIILFTFSVNYYFCLRCATINFGSFDSSLSHSCPSE